MRNPIFKDFIDLDKIFIKDKYKYLINVLFEFSDSFLLVIRNDLPQSSNCKLLLKELESNQIKSIKSNNLPLTIIDSDEYIAELFYYKANSETKNILLEMSTSLHDWIQPNLADDICFLKDNKYILMSCVHENIFMLLKEYADKLDY